MLNLERTLNAFRSSFKSGEIRILAIKDDEKTVNCLTSILFSNQPLGKKPKHLNQIERAFKNEIRFFFRSAPLQKINGFFEEIRLKGKVSLHPYDDTITFDHFDPFNDLRISESAEKGKEEIKWKIFYANKERATKEIEKLQTKINSQNAVAIRLGYSNMNDLIRENFKIKDWKKVDFLVEIPVHSYIEELNTKKVNIKKHYTLNNLQLNLILKRPNKQGFYEVIDRKIRKVEECEESKKQFCSSINDIKFQHEIKPQDSIEVTLINLEVPELEIDKKYFLAPTEYLAETFPKTLFEFYPHTVFTRHLFTPEQFIKPDKVFQDAVAKLLSIIGYSVIVLGKLGYREKKGGKNSFYDTIKLESGYPVGSTDIIAYREKQQYELLLIDCTIKKPDEAKIGQLQELVDHFSSKFNISNIFSLIFTPRDFDYQYSENVGVVDRNRIESLLTLALAGKTEDARSSIFW